MLFDCAPLSCKAVECCIIISAVLVPTAAVPSLTHILCRQRTYPENPLHLFGTKLGMETKPSLTPYSDDFSGATWNSRGWLSADHARYSIKADCLNRLISKHDSVYVQDTHGHCRQALRSAPFAGVPHILGTRYYLSRRLVLDN